MIEYLPKNLKRNWILVALMLSMILAAMDNAIVSTAIPQIVGDLGGFSSFTWLYSIYLLIQTITVPLYGKLADLYGRKRIIIFGIIIFLLGSALCGLAWDMVSLISFRGVQAIGAGAIIATVNTIAGDIYTVEERAKIQGWLSSVWGISAIAGPTLGGAIVEVASWQWIFFINIPFGLLSIYIIARFLFEPPIEKNPKVDWKGSTAMLITGSVILFALMETGKLWSLFSFTTLLFILVSAFLVYITILIERKALNPILPGWVWKERQLLGPNFATIGLGATMIGPGMYLAIFAQTLLNASAILAGLVLASISFTWPLFSYFSGKLYLKIGFRNTALYGVLLVIVGTISFFFIQFPGKIWMLFTVQMIMGAGFGLMSTPLLVSEQSIVSYKSRGVVTGSNMFSRYAGQSIGAAVLGVIFNHSLGKSMTKAPLEFRSSLPQIDEVVDVLKSNLGPSEIIEYLQQSFFYATHTMYIALVAIAILTLFAILWMPVKSTDLGK